MLSSSLPNPFTPYGGIFFADQAAALAKAGIKTGFICVQPISLKSFLSSDVGGGFMYESEYRYYGVDTYVYRFFQVPFTRIRPLRIIRKKGLELYEKYIQLHGRPDLVHVHNFQAGTLALELKKKYGIPYVISEHSSNFLNDSVPQAQRKAALEVYTNASARIAVSPGSAAAMEKFSGLPFHIVPNLVDTQFFTPGAGKPEIFTFFSAAGLIPLKNQELQIKAFLLFRKHFPDSRLIIAGDGPTRKRLEQSVLFGLQRHIQFTGALSREQVRDHMQQASAYLISSHRETFGVVAIEALSCGIPVISTPCLGPESILRDPKTGILTKDFEVSSYAAAMLELRRNAERYEKVYIRQFAIEHYSEEAFVKKITDIYKPIIDPAVS
ncbi:MAG: glycosyltransferase [Bacteroidia bacterium]|nr:glycosyltransferase [Bacteroidia bacterium]